MDLICDDFVDERRALDRLVEGLDEAQWDTPTASPGWTVRDQISHLWFFDQRALLALTDPDGFVLDAAAMMAGRGIDASIEAGRSISGAEMVARWRDDSDELVRVARQVDPSSRVPWYGPAMGARSFITARLMETWAHGQDVADALAVQREPTDRLRHVAHIGVRARPFSYATRSMTMPDAEVHVLLSSPDGETRSWGAPDSEHSVRGPLLDFCLVVTQRRHIADTALDVAGDAAVEWMSIAQAFAGPPGPGRAAGQFA
ncbi:MAG: hypothetical protein JWN99_1017 [Ilumatobacteraceae bacterium]|nr:hypothetical protein [Ilumatobacteraceae bacterium]